MRHRAALVDALLALLVATALAAGCALEGAPPSASEEGPATATAGPVTPSPVLATGEPTATPAGAAATPVDTVEPPGGPRVTILHTNDTYAYVDPCG